MAALAINQFVAVVRALVCVYFGGCDEWERQSAAEAMAKSTIFLIKWNLLRERERERERERQQSAGVFL